MNIIPALVSIIVVTYWEIIEQWVNESLYEKIIERARGHELVKLQGKLDWKAIEAACRGYHHQSGPGTKAKHSIEKYVRVLLVKYLYNWSYRETEQRLRYDLVVKWFVGYRVLDEVMDHSAICLFELWVSQQQHRIYWDEILRQIDQDLGVEAAVQIGDTFGMRADAAQESLVQLLRHSSRILLNDLKTYAPHLYGGLVETVGVQAWMKEKGEVSTYRMSKAEIQALKENTARLAWQLHWRVKEQLSSLEETVRLRITIRLEDVEKILRDEFRLVVDGDGQIQEVVELDSKHKGSYRICSATDPQATFRNHGRTLTMGFNVQVSIALNGMIREIVAATGAQPDQAGIADLIANQRNYLGICPSKLIYDQAAGAGRTRAEVERVSAGRTQLIARIPPPAVTDRFGPERFTVNEQGAMVCPAQRTTTNQQRSTHRDGMIYLFSAKCCAGCPLWKDCRESKANPKGPRKVFLSDYRDHIRQAQAYNQTPDFLLEMSYRNQVERIIAVLTRYDGLRRARFRGIGRIDFQAKMAAAGRNIRTWLKLGQSRSLACA